MNYVMTTRATTNVGSVGTNVGTQWLETEDMAGFVQPGPGGLVQTGASVATAAASPSEQPSVDLNYATMASDSDED